MENVLPSHNEALYRSLHNASKSYRGNNWGILTLKRWLRFLPAWHQTRIIEIGCGNGKLCRLLADMKYDVTGVDIVKGPYDREGYNFQAIDLQRGPLPFNDKEFDVAVSFDVLEHLEEEYVSGVLWDICRIAKQVIVVVPCEHEINTPLLSALHRTVRPAEWWIEKLNSFCNPDSHRNIIVFPDEREGKRLDRLLFVGSTA